MNQEEEGKEEEKANSLPDLNLVSLYHALQRQGLQSNISSLSDSFGSSPLLLHPTSRPSLSDSDAALLQNILRQRLPLTSSAMNYSNVPTASSLHSMSSMHPQLAPVLQLPSSTTAWSSPHPLSSAASNLAQISSRYQRIQEIDSRLTLLALSQQLLQQQQQQQQQQYPTAASAALSFGNTLQLPLQSLGIANIHSLLSPVERYASLGSTAVPLASEGTTGDLSRSTSCSTDLNMETSNLGNASHRSIRDSAAMTGKKGSSSSEDGKLAGFVRTLYEMLHDVHERNLVHIISFSRSGTSFQIHNMDDFETKILPKYFRATRFKSFQRQLYLYGFAKLNNGDDIDGYHHPCFQRNKPELLERILRKSQRFTLSSLPSEEARLARASGYEDNKSPFFPQKLYRLLLEAQERGMEDVICFTSDGKGFEIGDPYRFEQTLAPQFFSHSQLTSFRRQLNIYGFVKESEYRYTHPEFFVRGQPELLRNLKRSKSAATRYTERDGLKDDDETK